MRYFFGTIGPCMNDTDGDGNCPACSGTRDGSRFTDPRSIPLCREVEVFPIEQLVGAASELRRKSHAYL